MDLVFLSPKPIFSVDEWEFSIDEWKLFFFSSRYQNDQDIEKT
ncbi:MULTISPECIES: hypothetical protein [Aquimarina]|nr:MULTISPECIES: hypothetical protein [Aquimarina]